MIRFITEWWTTWRVWREASPETRAILLAKGHDPDDFIEADRPDEYRP